MIFSAGIFVLLFTVITILFFFFSKTKRPIQLGALYATIHLILVCLLAYFIYRSTDGEACMGWLIFYFIDIPSSLLIWLFNNLFKIIFGYSEMILNYHMPFAVFAIFGSLQYFLIGTGIGLLYGKITRRKA